MLAATALARSAGQLDLPHEVFAVVNLDAQNRVQDYFEMLRGTVSQTSVYPREVVRDALLRNSCSLVLVHNYPSGAARPSRADEVLTQKLKQAAAQVDVRVLALGCSNCQSRGAFEAQVADNLRISGHRASIRASSDGKKRGKIQHASSRLLPAHPNP